MYQSPKIPVQQLLAALTEVLMLCSLQFNIFIRDVKIRDVKITFSFVMLTFNINCWMRPIEGLYIISLLMKITIDSWYTVTLQITRHK